MRAWPIGRALVLSIVVCALAAGPALAQPASLPVTVGFDGAFRPGVPVPVTMRIPAPPAGGPAQLIIDAPALTPKTGRATVSTVVPFQAVAGIPTTLRAPVVIRDVRRPLAVRAAVGGRVFAAASVPLDPARVAGRLVVLVSNVRAGLGVLRRLDERAVDAYVTAGALPSRWQDYASVDLLVLRDLDPARLDGEQRDALLTWVQLGGRLAVIARPRVPLPAFLDPIMPAHAGDAGVLPSPADLSARYGGALPAGPIAMVALVAAPGAAVVRSGGAAVVAAHAAGDGYVTVWGIDPTVPPLADWDGRLRLWADAAGTPAVSPVDPAVLGAQLTPDIPVDRASQAAAGLLIAAYVGGLAVFRRRRPTLGAAATSLAAALAAAAVFAVLAAGARARSTALTQVAVLQQGRDVPLARALFVAAVAVPYGGRVAVAAPPQSAAAPQAILGDLRIVAGAGAPLLTGAVRPDAPWLFQAVAAMPLRASARFDAGAATLTADVPGGGLREAAVWWRDRVYPVGDLPAGSSAHRVSAAGWRRASEVVADDQAVARFLRGPEGQEPGPVTHLAAPVLIGRWPGRVPGFTLATLAGPSGGAAGTEEVVLVIPIDGPAPRGGP